MQDGSHEIHARIIGSIGDDVHETLSPRASNELFCRVFRMYQSTKEQGVASTAESPQHFYDVVHTPDPNNIPPATIQHPDVVTKLYPFQARAVDWLLQQEKVKVTADGSITPIEKASSSTPYSYNQYTDYTGHTFYASLLLRRFIRHPKQGDSLHRHLHGGILSEEMGLGKTVELIDLICLHRRSADIGKKLVDAYTDTRVTISPTTLIISPPAILDQWISELKSHAPTLKVFHYQGIKHSPEDIKKTLLSQDVVVTTYSVLASELHFANEKPTRGLRHEKKYTPRRSPLTKILWWRVCLDEAQMIESGVSNAATVARRIPRCNAWAVTGTPLKKDVKDLLGLLIFLRFEPFSESANWNAMGRFPDTFDQIFSTIALRHTKAQVREELKLPIQRRVVVTVPFTAIEEQHYKQLFEEMCADCGVDESGGPLREDWDPESEKVVQKMRTWLARLRQTCLHPEVGEKNRKALGRRQGPLRTVEEVLQVMIDQNETALRHEERSRIHAKLVQGHLYIYAKNVDKELALHHYSEALEAATTAVNDSRVQLRDFETQLQSLSADRDHDALQSSENDEESKERLGLYANRLRHALEAQHAAAFHVATAYYKMQETSGKGLLEECENYEKLEAEYYEIARNARQEMLRASAEKATENIDQVLSMKKKGFARIPQLTYVSKFSGIESRKIISAIDDLRDLMNRQALPLQEWREHLAKMVTTSLLDQGETEMTGGEYMETLKNQDEQYAYMFMFTNSLAVRHEMVTGQVNALAYHESKQMAKTTNEGTSHAPETLKPFFEQRKSLEPARNNDKPIPGNLQSLRGIIADIRSMITSVRFSENGRGAARARAEVNILETELQNLQRVQREQAQIVSDLEREQEVFREAERSRLEYHRQLQAISDSVRPFQEEESESFDEVQFKEAVAAEKRRSNRVRGLLTKRKFLQHLRDTKGDDAERRPCIICLQHFEQGVLTVCAHEFCKECISLWLSQHHRCPMCKKHLRRNDYHNITYKPRHLRAQEEEQTCSPESSLDSPSSASKTSIYSSITEHTLNEIKSIDIPRSWGSKIDSIARHLLWIQKTDPGCKSVVFSQYRDFLDVLGGALEACKIGYSSMTAKNGIQKFKQDASVECFLLHAKADSSGLNLVNATHVLLCEPLINTAIELQAIARVHRIGQRSNTTVWMYLVSDTVEESIYDISVSRRMALIGQRPGATSSTEPSRAVTPAVEEMKLDAVNSFELQSAPLSKLMTSGKSGGEMVAQDDLWSCLFNKPRAVPNDETSRHIDEEVSRHLRAEAADQRAGS